ncbi:MAG TPA: hypothetical protein VF297_01615 [Pyrinomonadaceae bacterium]
MLRVHVEHDRLYFGEGFRVSFQRTLRVPDDGGTYPLPPGLGTFPLHLVEDYRDRVPPTWAATGGVFIPLYQREALWLGFEGDDRSPKAVIVTAGGVNVVSGEAKSEGLRDDPQNYLVCPLQPWLDGINAGPGLIRQFVAVPLGRGYTVESQLTGREDEGGLRIVVFEPKPGRVPDQPTRQEAAGDYLSEPSLEMDVDDELGLGAGGRMGQNIYPDPYGLDTWDADERGEAFVRLVNTEQYRRITNLAPPPPPIDARAYAEAGLPWFELYEEAPGDVAAPESLRGVKSVGEIETERGGRAPEEGSLDASKLRVERARRRD